MRRREQMLGDVPRRLQVFTRSEWPGRDVAECHGAFVRAREIWKDQRGLDVLPDDERSWAAYPDGFFRPENV